jgi:hypothetical protein
VKEIEDQELIGFDNDMSKGVSFFGIFEKNLEAQRIIDVTPAYPQKAQSYLVKW